EASGTLAGPVSDLPPGNVGGTLSVRATARGPLRGLAIAATGAAEHARSGTTSVDRAALTAALTGIGGQAPAGRATLDLAGLRPGTGAPWTGTVSADWRRIAGVDTAAVTLHGQAEDGAQVASRGTLQRSPTGELRVELPELSLAPAHQPAWALTAPAALVVDGTTVTIGRLALVSGAQHLSASGRLGLSGAADASLDWRDVDLAWPCSLRGLDCAGRAVGTARVTGTADAPRLSLSLRADGVTVAKSPTAVIALTGDYAERA